MQKKFKVAILGCGTRGTMFTGGFFRRKDQFEVVALCDWKKEQLEKVHCLFGLENTQDFTSADEFLKEKRGDMVVISTDDRHHVSQCVKALKLGYDVLLEKPISDSREEIELLLKTQEETGKQVVVCHELRYGAGYRKCGELLKNGVIGKLYAIDASERAVYWHWAQAYVRGIGSSLEKGHPVILAKCSHDLDLLQFYAGSECESVSSVGSRAFFKKEDAPVGHAKRCVDCPHNETCPYSGKRIYIEAWKKSGCPKYGWPYSKVSLQTPLSEQALYEGLKTGAYGRCVFECEEEQMDHQMVQMHFKNGVNASLKMCYGAEPGRRIVFYGTHGEIVMDERADTIEIMPYGQEKEIVQINTLTEDGNAHGGGDGVLLREMYGILSGQIQPTTPLKESVECHLMGIAAEESRKQGGALIKVHS